MAEVDSTSCCLQAGDQHKAMGTSAEGDDGGEPEGQVDGQGTSRILEGEPHGG